MFSYLIRRALGPGVGGFWVGLVMVVVGIGLTVSSGVISAALGLQVTFVFYGLIVVGLVRMAAGLPSLFSGGGGGASGSRSYASSGPDMPYTFVAPPSMTPPGLCWQCGGRVKRGATLCYHCGATQASEKQKPEPQPAPAEYPPYSDQDGYGSYGGYGGYGQDGGPSYDAPPGPRPVTHAPRRGGSTGDARVAQGPSRGYGQARGYGGGYGPQQPPRFDLPYDQEYDQRYGRRYDPRSR